METCKPRLSAVDISFAPWKKPNLAPANFPSQELARVADFQTFSTRAGSGTLANALIYFSGNTAPPSKIRLGFNSAARALAVREEKNIVALIRTASSDEVAKFQPLEIKNLLYSMAASLPSVRQAISERKQVLQGVVASGSDTRSFAERSRVNAPPSLEDIAEIVTNIVLEDTRKATGYPMTRVSRDSFSFDARGKATSGSTDIKIRDLTCSPEGKRHRCIFMSYMLMKEKRLLGIREYEIGHSKHNALVYWGTNGLESSDLAKAVNGWGEVTQVRSSSQGGGSSRGNDLVDQFVERDRDNRDKWQSMRESGQTRQPYEPMKRY